MDTHVLEVPSGADIIERIDSFARRNNIGCIVLSALGAVENLTFQRIGEGAERSFPGRYYILSVNGTFLPPHAGGIRINMCLAEENGREIGGRVGGQLMASGLVKLILGSFSTFWDGEGTVSASFTSGLTPAIRPDLPCGQLGDHVLPVSPGADIISSVITYARENRIGVFVHKVDGLVQNVNLAQQLCREFAGQYYIEKLNWVFLPPNAGSDIYVSCVHTISGARRGGRVLDQLIASGPMTLTLCSYISTV